MTSPGKRLPRGGARQGNAGWGVGNVRRGQGGPSLLGRCRDAEGHLCPWPRVCDCPGQRVAGEMGRKWPGCPALRSSNWHNFQEALWHAECLWYKGTAWIWRSSSAAQTGICRGKDLPLLSAWAAQDGENAEITHSELLLLFCDPVQIRQARCAIRGPPQASEGDLDTGMWAGQAVSPGLGVPGRNP